MFGQLICVGYPERVIAHFVEEMKRALYWLGRHRAGCVRLGDQLMRCWSEHLVTVHPGIVGGW